MSRKNKEFLAQVLYKTEDYIYSFFYIINKHDIKLKNKKISIRDGDIEFIDGELNTEIYLYDKYDISVIENDINSLIVKIQANRHIFYAFKPKQFIREEDTAYYCYYKTKRRDKDEKEL